MTNIPYSLIAVYTLVLAVLVDLILGDPPWKLHPTYLMGKLIHTLEPRLKNPNPKIERLNGVFLALAVIGLFVIPIYFGLKYIYNIYGFLLYVPVAAILLKITFSIKLETKWAKAAARAVETGDLTNGRKIVSYFSRRETTDLSGPQIVSAIIESIAENLSDFKLSSIFYYSFFGVAGAATFRAINNLDSTIGFKDQTHINTGWFSAKLDTIANYIPARISTILIILSSAILGGDAKNTWKIARRDHDRISSINHGWPVAAMAGALGLQLEKPAYYIVGDNIEEITSKHIVQALKIRYVTIFLLIILLLPLLFLMTTPFPL